ncbi:MAG: response regulator [Verrucomicrobiales bacterium]|nr:response regulator [Verrucomicrobiales bacterium]
MTDIPERCTILYVEDEENDVFLVSRAFSKWAPELRLISAPDGLQAIRWLEKLSEPGSPERDFLSLVLLDLNLPKKNGFEVLQWIRQQPRYQHLPVVIYTSSDLQRDRDRARELGATRFEVKSGTIADHERLVQTLVELGSKN